MGSRLLLDNLRGACAVCRCPLTVDTSTLAVVAPIWLGFPVPHEQHHNAGEKSIVIRPVQRRRYTDTNGRTVRRVIRFNGPVLSSDLGGMKEGDQVTLWFEETAQAQVAIGLITADEQNREQLAREIQLTLPAAAFADFWNAASSTDSGLRNITLKIDDAIMEFTITDVILLEGTPVHPVVSELRFMWRPLRLFLIGLFAIAAVFVALEIVKVIWVLWHGGSAG